MHEKVLTISVVEAGRMLGIGRSTSYRLAREGKIPALRLGKKIRVPKEALLLMLSKQDIADRK